MNGNLYEIIAIGARYLFAVIMVIIVIRAWKITIIDSRRAASLRRLSPETGVCGEFIVLAGNGKVREGMRYPVIREGLIGSSRKADVRLRSRDVHRSHAFFELTKKGLRLRAQGRARVYDSRGNSRKELLLGDGVKITVGRIELMLILTEGTVVQDEPGNEGDMFDIPDDSDIFTGREKPGEPKAPSAAPTEVAEPDSDPFDDPLPQSAFPRRRPAPDADEALYGDNKYADEALYGGDQCVDEALYGGDQYADEDEPDIIPAADPYSLRFRRPGNASDRSYAADKSAAADAIDDIFMERSAADLRPENDDIWDDDDTDVPVKIWDDWEDAPAKPKVKRVEYDDPFDV